MTSNTVIQSPLDDQTVCPVCDDSFTSRKGMLSHHGQVHGGTVVRSVECANCATGLTRKLARLDRSDNFFCSDECDREWKTGREAPPGHNFRKNGKVEYECDQCGDTNKTYPSVLERGKKNFCDEECSNEWKRGREVDESHNFYKNGPAIVECAWCGETLERRPCKLERSENFFCGGDSDCQAKYKSKYVHGEDHPRWKGGHNWYYGPNWPKQREKRLEHDRYECCICGMENEDHIEEHGCEIHVHHIIRKEDFRDSNGDLDYERANAIDNLISLCYGCHGEWEGIPLRPLVN